VTIDRPALSDTGVSGGVEGPGRRTAAFLALTLVLFVALTAVMTYPQVLRMTDGVHDPGDPLMVTWVLAWVAHQLPIAPAHIFDANIFYPSATRSRTRKRCWCPASSPRRCTGSASARF
jgi:hypothetical protein